MRSKFEQLREGMTYDQVVAILGEPDTVRPVDPPLMKAAVWARRDSAITIFFGSEGVGFKWFQESDASFLDRVLSWFGL